MKHRIFPVMLMLALVLTLAVPCFAADDVTVIRNAAELRAVKDAPDGSYQLGADIDLGGSDWEPFPFNGKLDGQGHTIYNLRVRGESGDSSVSRDGNDKEYDTHYAALFSQLNEAEVTNLVLRDVDIRVESDEPCYAAGLAGAFFGSTVTNCTVTGRVYLYGHGRIVGVSGLIGYGYGCIDGCTVDVELVSVDRNPELDRCEEFLGGILANGIALIEHCTIGIDGYTSCHGYVHNGGIVGMFYHNRLPFNERKVRFNDITGQITFFEHNPSRRAYCKATIGEPLTGAIQGANENSFRKTETHKYDQELYPEKCAEPHYIETVTPHDCGSAWGYTDHVCSGCGYSWRDSYTAPGHEPGEWETVSVRDYGVDGVREQHCALCGELLDSEREPALIAASDILLYSDTAELCPEDMIRITAVVRPSNAENTAVVWSSSDPSVAAVDENGIVTALSVGTAEISCRSADGFAGNSLVLTVSRSRSQWIRHYLLFGWLTD